MTKERELLERAFESMKNRNLLTENERNLEREISYYLLSTPEPEVKREPLSDEEMNEYMKGISWMSANERVPFRYGVRYAEKMHGIGGGGE